MNLNLILNQKFRRHGMLIASLIIITFLLTACSAEKKVSGLITNAVTSADEAVKPTVDEKHQATAEEIKKIRKAESLVKEVAKTYKLVTRNEQAGPFDDMANALGARAEYLETGNKKAYDTFNSLYGKSREELLKFAADLKEKGL